MESFISNYVFNLIFYSVLVIIFPLGIVEAINKNKDQIMRVRKYYAIPTKAMFSDIRKYKKKLTILIAFLLAIWIFLIWCASPYFKDLPLLIAKKYECVEGTIESEYSSKGNISVLINSTNIRFGPWKNPILNPNKKYKFFYLPNTGEVVSGEELDLDK